MSQNEIYFDVSDECPYYHDGYTETKLVMRQGEFIIFGPGREPFVMQHPFEDDFHNGSATGGKDDYYHGDTATGGKDDYYHGDTHRW